MGTWGAGIWSDDTAQDLRSEYTCAFFKYSVEEAVQKLDDYVRTNFGDDDDEWCSYRYSLADFMWKKGILTPEIRDRTISMIDSGFALDTWEEAGNGALRERKKVLDKLRAQLISEQPSPKKIKPAVHLNNYFEPGDLIAIQLKTAGKKYAENRIYPLSDFDFHSFDGKYIVIQKISGNASWHSSLVPEICDYWLRFRLFAGTFDTVPSFEQTLSLPDAVFNDNYSRGLTPVFWCESSLVYFKRRKYVLLGNRHKDVMRFADDPKEHMATFGNDYDHINPDSSFIAAILRAKSQ